MKLPSVAIVGRANVGKSSLFNALCGERIAIVDSTPGVTRDRIAREVKLDGCPVEIVDTGGVGMESAEEIVEDVEMQIRIAIAQADVVLLVVDALAGLHPLDRSIARRLRRAEKDVLLVANKVDNERAEQNAAEFYELGFGEPVLTSAIHRRGQGLLAERVAERLPDSDEAREEPDHALKIAFVGRRNAGKSTLINFLANEPRVVVSEMPGTTRDSVDVRFQVEREDGGTDDFVAIDTAGVRKRRQLKESVDFYSQVRTAHAIKRADVAVQILDATVDITRVDRQLADQVISSHKPCIVALNKSDLIPEDTSDEEFEAYVWLEMPGLRFAPLVFISALRGRNVLPLLDIARELDAESGIRVSTSELNDVMGEVTAAQSPPGKTSRPGNILYATQVDVRPPTIALFVSDTTHISAAYERYLANQLREHLPFTHIPIRFLVRRRGSPDGQGDES